MTPSTAAAVDAANDRIEREARFHDEVFKEGQRRKSSRFYYLLSGLRAEKHRLIKERSVGKRVLEYGCGPEAATEGCWPLAHSVVLIDISPVAIDLINETAADYDHVHGQVMDAENLEFDDESFDLVVGDGILHHLDLDKSLSEINRVLAPGGTAVFIEPLAGNPGVELYRKLTPGERTVDEHPLTKTDVEDFESRFANVEVTSAGLTSLATAVMPAGGPQRKIGDLLSRVDRTLFSKVPKTKQWAWACLVDFRKQVNYPEAGITGYKRVV